MSTTFKNLEHSFSKDELKKAVSEEKITTERSVELNALAKDVAEQFGVKTINPFLVTGFLRGIEFLMILAAGFASIFFSQNGLFPLEWPHLAIVCFGSIAAMTFIQGFDGYITQTLKNMTNSFLKATLGLTMAIFITVALTFFVYGSDISEFYTTAQWYCGALSLLFLTRATTSLWVSKVMKEGRLERRAVIVGGGTAAADLINSLEANADSDIRICGIFDDRDGERSPDFVAGYPKLGTVPELIEFARTARINMLIVTIPMTAQRILPMLKRLWVLPVDIRMSAHANKLAFRQRSYSYEGSVPMLDVFEKPIADWDLVLKRSFDVFFASLALIVLSPIMLLTAIAIKLDSKGPVFFKQIRQGFNNEEIEIFKFRSLHTNQGDKSGVNVVTKNDSRVTRVGRFIRKSSIDELPQLVNVLFGTLSLVGPRPHVANAQTNEKPWNDVVEGYFARHKVKPGVTGWAQINGWRGEVDTEEKIHGRVDYDLYYIENWSVMFDLYILAITPFKLLNTENAY